MIKLLDLKAITMMHGEEIKNAVCRVIDSGWYLQGKEIDSFEKSYADYIGSKYCISMANGLDALKLIIRAYKELGAFKDGDEIIVPANTYIATIIAISSNGLVPVLVEPTWDNLEIDDSKIEQYITSRTRAVMIVHLYGRLAYTEEIGNICKKYGLILLEDCAQSQGCEWKGVKTGAIGDAAAHSFYPGKNLGALGDAGAVTTNNKEIAELVKVLANYGSPKKYVFKYVGVNSRMAETDAAVLGVKLKYLDEDNESRRKLASYYYDNIDNPLISLPIRIPNDNNVYHQFPIFCEYRDELQKYLSDNGIQTIIHYPIPPHKQECYLEWNDRCYPITEKIHSQELSIPMNQSILLEDAARVVSVLNSYRHN